MGISKKSCIESPVLYDTKEKAREEVLKVMREKGLKLFESKE